MRIEHFEVEFAGNPTWYKVNSLSSRLNAVLIPSVLGSPRAFRWSPVVGPATHRLLDRLSFANQSPNAVAELDELAIQLGLDSPSADEPSAVRERLVIQERELSSKIGALPTHSHSREQLLGRQRDIRHRLEQLRTLAAHSAAAVHYDSRLTDRLAIIDADLRGAQEEIEQCDQEIAEVKARLKVEELERRRVDVEPGYRQQLQRLEDRLDRWRQTLKDIKSHRESIESSAVDAHLDEQVAQQFTPGFAGDARAPMRSLESQLHHARQQVDYLVTQYASGYRQLGDTAGGFQHTTRGGLPVHSYPVSASGHHPAATDPSLGVPESPTGYFVHQDSSGRTQIAYHAPSAIPFSPGSLPELLHSMQRDLHEVCNQLSHQESRSATKALQQQVEQLKRCETELLQSVQRLIDQRANLLRKIADKYNLTSDQISLAFGDWCQCSDHKHLKDWLLEDERAQSTVGSTEHQSRNQLLERLSRLDDQRKKAVLRSEECRRQLREAERTRTPRATVHSANVPVPEEVDLTRELSEVNSWLSNIDIRERLIAELDQVRLQLQSVPPLSARANEFQQLIHKHIIGLSGSLYRQVDYRLGGANREAGSELAGRAGMSTADWGYSAESNQYDVPRGIVITARNLAIAQSLAARGEIIPVVLYQALDSLNPEALNAAVSYVAWFGNHQTVIVMTRDSRVSDVVNRLGGQVHRLTARSNSPKGMDVNQQLAAYANEEEASKWYKPSTESPDRFSVRQYYLSEHASVEELTAIPTRCLDRLHYLGIDRIGDLLDADPAWVSNHLNDVKVNERTVRGWQAVAELLCSVRGLRPFDAQVLAGAGVRNAEQLSTVHPAKLLERVELFLATEKGRRILQSGNRYELTRITSWIASAKSGTPRRRRSDDLRQSRTDRRAEVHRDNDRKIGPRGEVRRFRGGPRPASRVQAERLSSQSRVSGTTRVTSNGPTNQASSNGVPADTPVRFYLDLSSPVIDAPSIGSRMSERLSACGVLTVDQLLRSNPESLARRIAHRRVNAETVRAWQLQARLVCQIPFLRGHDAQMLVACNITTPERLAGMPANAVLEQVLGYAQTSEGQRTLRGNKQPDLDEVQHWIHWAGQFRSLNAA